MNLDSKSSQELESLGYKCWLNYNKLINSKVAEEYRLYCQNIVCTQDSVIIQNIMNEMSIGLNDMLDIKPTQLRENLKTKQLIIGTFNQIENIDQLVPVEVQNQVTAEGYLIRHSNSSIILAAKDEQGLIFGAFELLRVIQSEVEPESISIISNPKNRLRMINHWDNIDGSIERGYAGKSIFFKDNEIVKNLDRIKDYGRLLSSVGINSIVINNVNVHQHETYLITDKHFSDVVELADIFRGFGIKLYLCANFASPMELSGLTTADPLDQNVQNWWNEKVSEIYSHIPDFGGFIIKADSEFRPGPFTYNRTHADGANMFAKALESHGGVVIWRCFVYNCLQDWRDHSVDRARSAYDNFMPLDGKFMDNVILQIKNGPMDFQVREPVSPLIGGLKNTNITMEFQITQEYTGQQKHLCYLVPMWKEALDFDTYAKGLGSDVKSIISGSLFKNKISGIAAVVNVGNDPNWTGLQLAQANLYGYARLAWNPDFTEKEITEEWIKMTFSNSEKVIKQISKILLSSWEIFEDYTTPLGIGWMVNPNHHFGPNIDGYEYDKWGTYHRADHLAMGIDRSGKSGTGFAAQYYKENAEIYGNIETCPEELLLFFHRIPYDYTLKSGTTLIQYIYDTHFNGVEKVTELQSKWSELKDDINSGLYHQVSERLKSQYEYAVEWRDRVNTYFLRKSGVPDMKGRKIY